MVAEWLNEETSDRSSDGCFSSLSDSGSGSDDDKFDKGDSDGEVVVWIGNVFHRKR